MEVFFILLLVVLLIANISFTSSGRSMLTHLSQLISGLKDEVTALRKEIGLLKEEIKEAQQSAGTMHRQQVPPVPPVHDEAPAPAAPPPVVPLPPVAPPPAGNAEEWRAWLHTPLTEDAAAAAPLPEDAAVNVSANAEHTTEDAADNANEKTTQQEPPHHGYREAAFTVVEEESWTQKWTRNNPDLEKFIGENLINKVGIAILVLGIAFFVKYAIDQDWINEAGRVAIGIGCGMALTGLAHYLRRTYRSFSSVLAGGGIAVFYFTIAFAFHQYHLMSQTAAFVIMVVISAFAVALSVLYDKLELAVIAAIGGFITPFLVSTGEGNYIVLFTYLIILNIGLLSLAWFRRWPVINTIALYFTVLIFGGWLINTMAESKPVSYPTGLLFATIFYVIFLGMNMIHQVRMRQKFRPFDFFTLLLISVCYYSAGMALLNHIGRGSYNGFFTLGIAMVNLGLAYYVHRRGDTDKNLLFLLIGLTLTFLTLTIPIQLHGHAITMFWSAEFVLLYWLAGYSGIRMFRQASLLICVLALASLLMDWSSVLATNSAAVTLIYRDLKGFVTNVISVAAFGGLYVLIRRAGDGEYVAGIDNVQARRASLVVALTLLYLTSIFGVNLLLRTEAGYYLPNVYHRIITGLFGLALLRAAQRKEHARPGLFILPLIVCFAYFIFSAYLIEELRTAVLVQHRSAGIFAAHWASSIVLGILFAATIAAIRRNAAAYAANIKGVTVFVCAAIVTFLSVEMKQVYMMLAQGAAPAHVLAAQYNKAGLTVLWALCSFTMMWLGMKHRAKVLRIVSLALFSLALLKLFILDISGISEGGKILAFILLGVLLLTISFMYQKLKKIIFDDGGSEQ